MKHVFSKIKHQYSILNKQQSFFVKGEVSKIKTKLIRVAVTSKEAEIVSHNARLETLSVSIIAIIVFFNSIEK